MTLADFLDTPFETPEFWPTGLSSLDEVVGGMTAGRVWLIIGAPGEGKSTLLTQLAFRLAVDLGIRVQLASPIDDADQVRARLMALAGVGRLSYPAPGVTSGTQARNRLEELRAARMDVQAGGGFGDPMWPASEKSPRCWAVDDAHFAGSEFDQTIRCEAKRGAFVLASLPRDHVVTGPRWEDPLVTRWAAVADLILEVEVNEPSRDREWPGDVRLTIHRNRRGPCLQIPLTSRVGHGRFVEPK